MEIKESRQVTAIDDRGKKHFFTVPLDFDLTNEYIEDKVKNKKRTKAEEWLKRKGFVEEPRGWSFYGDGEVDVKLPTMLVSEVTQEFYINFHRVEGVRNLVIPIAYSKKLPGSYHRSMNKFPDYIESKWLSINGLPEHEELFYKEKVKNRFMLSEFDFKIDDFYLLYLIKNKELYRLDDLDINRFQIELFKNIDTEAYNLLTSKKGINKYQL